MTQERQKHRSCEPSTSITWTIIVLMFLISALTCTRTGVGAGGVYRARRETRRTFGAIMALGLDSFYPAYLDAKPFPINL